MEAVDFAPVGQALYSISRTSLTTCGANETRLRDAVRWLEVDDCAADAAGCVSGDGAGGDGFGSCETGGRIGGEAVTGAAGAAGGATCSASAWAK